MTMSEYRNLEAEKAGQVALELSENDIAGHSENNSEIRVESTHQGIESTEAESLESKSEYTRQEQEVVSTQAPTESLSLEDGVPETLLEKLDEAYGLVEEDFL